MARVAIRMAAIRHADPVGYSSAVLHILRGSPVCLEHLHLGRLVLKHHDVRVQHPREGKKFRHARMHPAGTHVVEVFLGRAGSAVQLPHIPRLELLEHLEIALHEIDSACTEIVMGLGGGAGPGRSMRAWPAMAMQGVAGGEKV